MRGLFIRSAVSRLGGPVKAGLDLRSRLLEVDAAVNLALGILLLFSPRRVLERLGLPRTEESFYPSVLGAVLNGVGVALLIERFKRKGAVVGLGLGGAVAINLSAASVLAGWLASRRLRIPLRGQVVLSALLSALVAISAIEMLALRRNRRSRWSLLRPGPR